MTRNALAVLYPLGALTVGLGSRFPPAALRPPRPRRPPPPLPRSRRRTQDAVRAAVAEDSTLTASQVAERLGLSCDAVHCALLRAGVRAAPGRVGAAPRLSVEEVAAARALLASGVRQREVARRVGVHPKTLRRSLRRHPLEAERNEGRKPNTKGGR